MPTSAAIKVSTLSYIIIYVKDTDKSSAFFRDILGLKEKMNHPGWVEFETGGTTLALHGTEKPFETKGQEAWPIVVFTVDDIQTATAALKAAGVKVLKEAQQVCEEGDKVGLSTDFEDPDGNRFAIFSLVKK